MSIMRYGYIYKIYNTVNHNVYIGQTTKSIDERFRMHIMDAKYKKNDNSILHKAMRKYGFDKFFIDMLEQCSVDILDEREIYWISFFDSYSNGYNMTLGGAGVSRLDLDEYSICKLYESGMSKRDISGIYNISKTTVLDILKKHNICIRSLKEEARLRGLHVVAKNINGDEIVFDSLKDAGEFIINLNLTTSINYKVVAASIRNAILRQCQLYGFYWYSNDFTEEYIMEQRMKIKNMQFKNSHSLYIKSKISCPVCGNLMDKQSKICLDCYKNQKKKISKCPSKDVLKNLISDYSNVAIAKMYNVSEAAVRKWINNYNLVR